MASSAAAATSTASTQDGSISVRPPSRITAMRSDPSGVGCCGGVWNKSASTAPCTAARKAAVSRTVRVTTSSEVSRDTFCGFGTSPRVVLRPTSPFHAAGSRVEPPPSLACAIGTMPLATAAPEPPLLPAGERVRSHGLFVGPQLNGWVVGTLPISGRLVLPIVTKPADRKREPSSVSAVAVWPSSLSARLPAQ